MRDSFGPLQPSQLCVCGHRALDHRFRVLAWLSGKEKICTLCGDEWARYFPC